MKRRAEWSAFRVRRNLWRRLAWHATEFWAYRRAFYSTLEWSMVGSGCSIAVLTTRNILGSASIEVIKMLACVATTVLSHPARPYYFSSFTKSDLVTSLE